MSNNNKYNDDLKHSISFVANNNSKHHRSSFINECSQNKIEVKCAGQLLNNDVKIGDKLHDKHEYIKQFVFNLCPENSFHDGYTTEKLLDSCICGCIPIYWGDPNIETIFNTNRMLIISEEDVVNRNFQNTINKVLQLLNDKILLKRFYEQPIFTNNAIDIINTFINKFDSIAKNFKHNLH